MNSNEYAIPWLVAIAAAIRDRRNQLPCRSPADSAFPGAEGYGSTTIGERKSHRSNQSQRSWPAGSLRQLPSKPMLPPHHHLPHLRHHPPRKRPGNLHAVLHRRGPDRPKAGWQSASAITNSGVNGTHDVVIRYIRVRRGDESRLQDDGLSVYENTKTRKWAENVIVDHCSVSWTCDEGINTWHHARNVTIQWCIVSEALHDAIHVGHGFAATVGGEYTTYHHNLLANCPGRDPSIGGNNNSFKTVNLDWRNNVIFNWQSRTLDGKPWSINVINNYFKPGPMTTLKDRFVRMDKINSDPQGYWYVGGNYYDGNEAISQNNRKGIEADGGLNPDDFLLATPRITAPVNTQSAVDCYPLVLADAGATLPQRDPVDTRVIDEVRTGKTHHNNGIVNSQTDVGGWPELKSTEPPIDTDHDGIPDWWEKKYGLNPNDPSDTSQDKNGDGYTTLEKYLNGLDPNAPKIDWTKPEKQPQQIDA